MGRGSGGVNLQVLCPESRGPFRFSMTRHLCMGPSGRIISHDKQVEGSRVRSGGIAERVR